MGETIEVDLCVIGAGSGGLTVAAGASQMGASVVLIEMGRMGGDCLNYGCVPSKSLIAAANAAHGLGRARRFGVEADVRVDFPAVHRHVEGVIAAIAPNDSEARFEGLGVRVIRAAARFTGPREVEADGRLVRARRFVIATGSRPLVPPIPGLESSPHLTNETIFECRQAPEHLIIIGGGPIGIELAQAHRRLGARVSVVEMATILGKDDPELVDVLRVRLRAEGIELLERAKVVEVARRGAGAAVALEGDGGRRWVEGSHLLVAVGRQPNVEGLGLEAAGVEHARQGVVVDRRLRTTNPRIYAVGDVAGGPQFTHMASYHAGIVIRNALFRLPAKVDLGAFPWATFTDPELAHVGLDEARARAGGGGIRVLRWPFAENDRAQAERATDGLIKVVTTPRGRILGASILGAHAAELILPWVLAIGRGMGIGALANLVVPYPTFAEVSKRAAGSYYAPTLFGERTRRIVRLLARLG